MVILRKVTAGWKTWLTWVGASAVGFDIVGFDIGIGGSLAASNLVSETVASAALGIVVGLAQWLILRRLFRPFGWWKRSGMNIGRPIPSRNACSL
jgi:hypothetical protein